MNKTLFSILAVMLLMSVSVLGFNYYENYTLNESMVVAYDDFNRTGSEVGNFTYPTTDFWVETSNQTIQDIPTFSTDGEQLVINKTQGDGNNVFLVFWDGTQENPTNFTGIVTTEYDAQFITGALPIRTGSDKVLDTMGNRILSLNWYQGTLYISGAVNSTSVSIDNDWHHYKRVSNLATLQSEVYIDGQLVLSSIDPQEGQNGLPLINVWDFQPYDDGWATTEALIDNFVIYEGNESPYYVPEPPCEPNWTCSGYGDCLINDTQPCNETTDENMCGVPYEGDYTEFEPLVCDFCTPLWICVGYDTCLENDTQVCNTTEDFNTCGESYTGNYSEFELNSCDFCTPDWNCSSFDECVGDTKMCLNVTDLNTCGEPFGGLLEDYDESCEVVPPITGYVPLFKSGDLPGLFGDLLGNGLYVLIGLAGLVVVVVVGVVGVNRLKKVAKNK